MSKAEGGTPYGFVYVDQESFEQHKPASFAGLASVFREYQDENSRGLTMAGKIKNPTN